MIDPTSGEQTEINERGPEVRPEEVDWFMLAAGDPANDAEPLE